MIRSTACDCPANAHDQITNVVEVSGQTPKAVGKQFVAIVSGNKRHFRLTIEIPNLILAQIATSIIISAEVVLLYIGHTKENHSQGADKQANCHMVWVVIEGFLLCRNMSQETYRIVPAKEAHTTICKHVAVQIVADVRRCEVSGLIPIVVEDVVPMGDDNDRGRKTDIRIVALRRVQWALNSVIWSTQFATIVDRSNVGLIANDPTCQRWASVCEALHIQWLPSKIRQPTEYARVLATPKK